MNRNERRAVWSLFKKIAQFCLYLFALTWLWSSCARLDDTDIKAGVVILLTPSAALLVSLLIGGDRDWGRWKWLTPFALGALGLLPECLFGALGAIGRAYLFLSVVIAVYVGLLLATALRWPLRLLIRFLFKR